MRVIFMGTPDFAVPSLQAITASRHQVLGVVTRPDRPRGRGRQTAPPPVKVAAGELGLTVWQPEKVNDPAFIAQLRGLKPEVAVVVAYGQLLKKELLELPARGCVNVHASLLPRYRGAAPIHRVVLNGEMETGITTMYMAETLDTGDMILQSPLTISATATTGSVHDRLSDLGAGMIVETLDLIAAGQAPRRPQDNNLATYAPPLTRADEEISWVQPAGMIYNQIRGLNPWPVAYTIWNDQPLKIWSAEFFSQPGEQPNLVAQTVAAPGTVREIIKGRGFVVETTGGRLLVTAVQPPGKRMMTADEFCRGYHLEPGVYLK